MAYAKKTYRKSYKPKKYTKKPMFSANRVPIPFTGKSLSMSVFKRSVDSIVQAEKECKRKFHTIGQSLLQETWYTANLLSNISKGTTVQTRESDVIKLCSLKGTITIRSGDTLQTDTTVRLMLCRSKIEGQSGSNDYTSSTLGNSTLTAFSPNFLYATNLDPKLVQTLYDKTFTIRKNLTAVQHQIQVPINIKLDIPYTYKSGSNYGSKYNLYWVATAHQIGGSTGTTTVSTIYHDTELLFKDM